MMKKALLITGQESETISTLARNLIPAGGLSIFARQMKQMKAIGVDEMHVVTDWFAQDFEKEILNCAARPEKIFIHTTKDAPLRLLEHNNEGNSWLLLEEAVLLDDRIIDQTLHHPASTVISFIGHSDFLSAHTANGLPLHLGDDDGFFGSVAKLSSQALSANVRKLNTLEGLPNVLKAIARTEGCAIARVTEIPLYLSRQRRDVDLVWFPVMRREDGDKATDILLEHCQKGLLDWPARFIHRPVENLIVKYLCKIPISPNQITILNGILGFYVMFLFAYGHMWPALIGAAFVGILAGVDGKLAQVKILQSRLGVYEYLLTRLIEYGWYFAIAAALYDPYGMAPYIMAAALVLFQVADHIQTEFFRRMTNMYLFNLEPFDQRFQLIAGGRNFNIWAILPFALFNQWFMALGFICIYAVITFFVHQIRLVYHLKNIMIKNSEKFAENFNKTKSL
ncbi:MAG: CDP-alcohol phosphatidyltransferase family protein [Emcibacter sp.]|nr:CDP-alcohol phosphatidyltransferase family protein [Emcibacter sp.]